MWLFKNGKAHFESLTSNQKTKNKDKETDKNVIVTKALSDLADACNKDPSNYTQ